MLSHPCNKITLNSRNVQERHALRIHFYAQVAVKVSYFSFCSCQHSCKKGDASYLCISSCRNKKSPNRNGLRLCKSEFNNLFKHIWFVNKRRVLHRAMICDHRMSISYWQGSRTMFYSNKWFLILKPVVITSLCICMLAMWVILKQCEWYLQ